MFSLSTIPEPTNNAPKLDAPDAAHQPISTSTTQQLNSFKTGHAKAADEADQQIDSMAAILLLLIAGGMLRLVLGMLGPMQGIDESLVEQSVQRGQQALAGEPDSAFPLFDLLSHTAQVVGLSGWWIVMLGSLITLAAVPAAYWVGLTLTGRRVAGVLSAAIIAVHPAILTASNTFAAGALALGLLTFGLASVCWISQRGSMAACLAGVLLGIAGLTSPLCWLVGVSAGPLAYRCARQRGSVIAFATALMVTFLACAPAMSFRVTMLGAERDAWLAEFSSASLSPQSPSTLDRLIVNMTDPSFQELGEAMHLPLGDAGRLKVAATAHTAGHAGRDVVADFLADGWLILNAALSCLAAVSVGIMLARRRLACVVVLAIPLAAMAFCTLPPGEALRLPMLAMLSTLAAGLFATPANPLVSEAERQARHLAKLDKQQAKEQARQQRELDKHKSDLFAFDQPTKPKHCTKPSTQAPLEQGQAILMSTHEDSAPIGARPI